MAVHTDVKNIADAFAEEIARNPTGSFIFFKTVRNGTRSKTRRFIRLPLWHNNNNGYDYDDDNGFRLKHRRFRWHLPGARLMIIKIILILHTIYRRVRLSTRAP